MNQIARIVILLLVTGISALGQQSYVLYKPSPTGNPYYDTNLVNVVINNVTFHGKVTFMGSNTPSLWNTNGAGLYSPSDSHAHSIRFGSNNVMGVAVRHSSIFGTFNTNGSGSWSTTIFGSNNWILNTSVGATISGGEGHQIGNEAPYATIGGGSDHLIDGGAGGAGYNVIAGGQQNRVFLQYGSILGGQGNLAESIGSTIGGGVNNRATRGDYTTLGGGEQNIARGDWAFLGGGTLNTISANASGSDGLASALVGGTRNLMGSGGTAGANYSFLGGGRSNLVMDASDYGVLGGGSLNQIGGGGNQVLGNVIAGGFNNLTDDQIDFSVIGGGVKNRVGADWGAILGGVSNNVTADRAMAIGNYVTNATAGSVEIGQVNVKSRFDASGLTVNTLATATNGFASYSSNLLAVTSVALSGTPAFWTNTLTKNVQAVWSGGTVSGVAVNNSLWPTPAASGYVILQPGEWLAFTNTGVPEFAWKPL